MLIICIPRSCITHANQGIGKALEDMLGLKQKQPHSLRPLLLTAWQDSEHWVTLGHLDYTPM